MTTGQSRPQLSRYDVIARGIAERIAFYPPGHERAESMKR